MSTSTKRPPLAAHKSGREGVQPNASFFEDPLCLQTIVVPLDPSTDSLRALELGAPVEKLIAASARPDIDMVITSTHGYSGLRHALLGSVAEQLARRATCPVLVVPSHPCSGKMGATEG